MTTREDARDVGPVLASAERSAVAGIRGLRWWVVVLVAAVLAVAGVAADLLQSGELGIFYTICFPVGAVMAAVWVRRGELFATCVQPPLLLAVGVPVAVVVTGSLPRTGGLTAKVLAVGGPMINGFPAMAITTAVCLAVAFVRSRLQPLGPALDDHEPAARPARDRRDRDRTERTDPDRTERVGPPRPDERRPEQRRPDDRRPDDRRPDDRRPDDRRPDDRRPDDRRSNDRRSDDRRSDDRRGEPGRPAARPASRPDRAPGRRPGGRGPDATEGGEREEPRDPRREGREPGVYRVPRPPQSSRPGGRPTTGAPERPAKRPPPPEA